LSVGNFADPCCRTISPFNIQNINVTVRHVAKHEPGENDETRQGIGGVNESMRTATSGRVATGGKLQVHGVSALRRSLRKIANILTATSATHESDQTRRRTFRGQLKGTK